MEKKIIILFGVALAISISGAYILGAVVLILCVKRFYSWKKSPLDIPFILYVLWGALRAPSLDESIGAHSAVFFFYLAAHGFKKEDVGALAKGFFAGSVASSLWAGLQLISGVHYFPFNKTYEIPAMFSSWPESIVHKLAERDGRGTGFRSHPLTFAEGLMPAFLLLSSRWLQNGVEWKKYVFPVVLLAFGLLVAQGRGIWLGVVAGLIVLGIILDKKTRLTVFLSLAVGGLLLVTVSPSLRGRAFSMVSGSYGSVGDQQSKSIRLQIWRGCLEKIKGKPFIGVGIDKIRIETDIAARHQTWSEAHNIYLQTWTEEGAIGLGLLLWIFLLCGRLLFSHPTEWRMGFFACFIAFLAAGFTESWLNDKEIAMIFFTMLGAAECLRNS